MSEQSLDDILKSLQEQIERLRRLTEREPLTKHDANGRQLPRTSIMNATSTTWTPGSLTLESLKATIQRLNTCGLCGLTISKTDRNIKLDLVTHRVFHKRCPAL